jgi:hypothetical protein
MNCELVEKIANAVLYEGYMLYPYTASSLKNQQRWTFGVLHPPGDEASEMRTEVLVEGGEECEFRARVRFLWHGDGEEPEEQAIDVDGFDTRRTVRLPHNGAAAVTTASKRFGEKLCRLSVRVRNETEPAGGKDDVRHSMLSTHTILVVRGGAFVSLMDPPPEHREAAQRCRNVGTWPVLVGTEGERSMMLSSPIILYDYPQIAPESPGDLFDGTEIDEILTLRILTLSDGEKAEIRGGGARAREVLERAESLPPEHLMKLHGAVRGLRPSAPALKAGDRVRLRPRKGADILDIALAGKMATVEAVEQDFEGKVHLAVVVDDDPGREFGMIRMPGHRFFFGIEEVEPVA